MLPVTIGCAATTLALRDGLEVQRLVYFSPPLDPSDYVTRFGDILNISAPVLDRMKARIEQRFLRKWSDYSLAETAREMTTPLLVIHDQDDHEALWEDGAALTEAWPGARMITTSGLGHRRIALIGGPDDVLCCRARLDGYRAALDAANLPFDPALVVRTDLTQGAGHAAARELIGRPDRPTAIFAGNDLQALGLYEAARELGLKAFAPTMEHAGADPQLLGDLADSFRAAGQESAYGVFLE